MLRGDGKALSNFPSECFWGRRGARLSMLSSSLFFTLSGSWHGAVCVWARALVCMPVWLTHTAVNSVILRGPAVQGLHWHPTPVLKHKQTQVPHIKLCAHKHTHTPNHTCKTHTYTHTSLALLRLRFSIFSSITFHCYLF